MSTKLLLAAATAVALLHSSIVTGQAGAVGTEGLEESICSGTGVTNGGTCPVWTGRLDAAGDGPNFSTSVVTSPDGSAVYIAGYGLERGTYRVPAIQLDYDYYVGAYDAVTGARQWVATYDGPGHGTDEQIFCTSTCLAVSPDGSRVFVTGASIGPNGGYDSDYATVALDATSGSQLWVARYSGQGAAGAQDRASSIAMSPDGARVFVTGLSYGSSLPDGTGWDYATVAYDAATGAQDWVARYNGTGSTDTVKEDAPVDLVVSPDGMRVFVTGRSSGTTNNPDYATVAYEAVDGRQIWAARYASPGSGPDTPAELAVSPDGERVYVTGWADGGWRRASADFGTIAYDTDTGGVLWVQHFHSGGPVVQGDDFMVGSNADIGVGLAVSPDSSYVYVTGRSATVAGTLNYDFLTIQYDAVTGEPRWTQRYDGPANANDLPTDIAVSPDGTQVYVSGSSAGIGTGFYVGAPTYAGQGVDYLVVAYDALEGSLLGNRLWANRYDGNVAWDTPQDMALSPDGSRLYLTGESDGNLGGTVRVSSNGQTQTVGSDLNQLVVAYNTEPGS